MLAKEELQVKIKDAGIQNSDLPTITCEIRLGREKKTIVNFFGSSIENLQEEFLDFGILSLKLKD